MRSTQVTFRMPLDSERRFLRAYMPAALDRLDARDDVVSAYFWRFGDTATHEPPVELTGGTVVDGGGAILVVTGDPDATAAIDAERPHWEECRERGLVETVDVLPWAEGPGRYESAREKMVDGFGERGGDLAFRLRPIISRTTADLLREFEEDLPAVGEESDSNPHPIADWALIHYLMKQNGHDWYGEVDACCEAIANRAYSLAQFYDEERGLESLDRAIETLETVRDELPETVGSPAE